MYGEIQISNLAQLMEVPSVHACVLKYLSLTNAFSCGSLIAKTWKT